LGSALLPFAILSWCLRESRSLAGWHVCD